MSEDEVSTITQYISHAQVLKAWIWMMKSSGHDVVTSESIDITLLHYSTIHILHVLLSSSVVLGLGRWQSMHENDNVWTANGCKRIHEKWRNTVW